MSSTAGCAMADLRPSTLIRPAPTSGQSAAIAMTNLRWLERYAAHCGFHTQGADSLLNALRAAFGAAAWRIVCRSPKACFVPILRHRELSIHSLITYCKRLAERSFVQAPKPLLLEYFVRQRRLYFDRPCRIPQGEDFDLMRVANRHEPLRLRRQLFYQHHKEEPQHLNRHAKNLQRQALGSDESSNHLL